MLSFYNQFYNESTMSHGYTSCTLVYWYGTESPAYFLRDHRAAVLFISKMQNTWLEMGFKCSVCFCSQQVLFSFYFRCSWRYEHADTVLRNCICCVCFNHFKLHYDCLSLLYSDSCIVLGDHAGRLRAEQYHFLVQIVKVSVISGHVGSSTVFTKSNSACS